MFKALLTFRFFCSGLHLQRILKWTDGASLLSGPTVLPSTTYCWLSHRRPLIVGPSAEDHQLLVVLLKTKVGSMQSKVGRVCPAHIPA